MDEKMNRDLGSGRGAAGHPGPEMGRGNGQPKTEEELKAFKEFGLSIGYGHVESGPLVRSSYHAEEQVPKAAPVPAPTAAA